MGMNAAQRQLWVGAVRSSYTVGEARSLLTESPLKEARVYIIPRFAMLGIEWRKADF
jgi:hypothetical protein